MVINQPAPGAVHTRFQSASLVPTYQLVAPVVILIAGVVTVPVNVGEAVVGNTVPVPESVY